MSLHPLLLAAMTFAPGQDLASLAAPRPVAYADLPEGFAETVVTRGLTGATGMAIAPDGRVFVCEQTGALRVVKGGKLLAEPFVKLAVDSAWERGLIGVALDPGFPEKPFIYFCYVAEKPYPHHRVSRFTAKGDVAIPGSEVVLLEGDDQRKLGGSVPAGHQGGPIAFGPDGKLYVCVGEQTAGDPAQRLDTFQGKLLRINADGSIPADNPFYHSAKGKYRAIWALGLRNPFGLAFQRGTGRLFVTDVGGSRYEEVNEVKPGGNYGWPAVEGPSARKGYVSPLHAYDRSVGRCITAGVFYDPAKSTFPDRYRGKYFFADYIDNWVRVLDPRKPGEAEVFARGMLGPVDLRFAADGSLYVLNRNVWVKDGKFKPSTGSLHRIAWAASDPSLPRIVRHPADAAFAAGEKVTLRVEASGASLAYQWERDVAAIKGADTPSLDVTETGRYRCLVTSAAGAVRTRPAHVRALPLLPAVPAEEDPEHGLLSAPADGVYTFHVKNGQATVWLDLRRIDGPVGLRKGLHRFRLVQLESKGNTRPRVEWDGPGFAAREVTGARLGSSPTTIPKGMRAPPWTLQVPPTPEALPARLSQTGVFDSLNNLKPAPGVIPYEVNSPLWSDGASKRRWVALPHQDRIHFQQRGEWGFPANTVFIKHFELPDDKGPPRRLETRILVADGEGSGYGVTYRWRPDGTDADLLHDGLTETVGTTRWTYPSRGDCLVCHNRAAGFVLGVNARQLNRGDQLARWGRQGILDTILTAKDPAGLQRLCDVADAKTPLEERVRSYLDVNCAFCHRPGGPRGEFDLRYDAWSPAKLLKAPLVAADLGRASVRLVAPGDPARSMLHLRMARREDVFNMPPLASAHADARALEAVAAWIRGLKDPPAGRPSR